MNIDCLAGIVRLIVSTVPSDRVANDGKLSRLFTGARRRAMKQFVFR